VQPDPGSDLPPLPDTIDAAIDHALDALEALGSIGEDIEDEWQYVQDLGAAWRDRLEEVASNRQGERLPPAVGRAVARACDEAGLITDPHRAIDWLSTLPQVILAQLGERP
jgi:hypothetical protein